MATHCSILAWRIPWTEEPVGLRVRHDWANGTHWHCPSLPKPHPLFCLSPSCLSLGFLLFFSPSSLQPWNTEFLLLDTSPFPFLTLHPSLTPIRLVPIPHFCRGAVVNPGWRFFSLAVLTFCVLAQSCSRVWLFATPWTVACQAPLSMRVSRQEYWSGLLSPPPRELPDSGLEAVSPMAFALAGGFFTNEPPGEPTGTRQFFAVGSCPVHCKTFSSSPPATTC